MSCPDCFKGHVHDDKPRGIVTKLHGLDVYVSEPTGGRTVKGIIVIIPDAFGWEFVNNRLLADHFTEKGDYRAYLPDFMKGNAAPAWTLDTMRTVLAPGFSFSKVLAVPKLIYGAGPVMALCGIDRTYPWVRDFFTGLRGAEAADLPVGAAGYCWGGAHVMRLAAARERVGDRTLIDAGFTGHPSMIKLPADIEAVKLPVSIAVGDQDLNMSVQQAEEARKVLEAKPEKERGEVKIYEGAGHGFAVRADLKMAEVAMQAAGAEHQCLDWFNRHFGL